MMIVVWQSNDRVQRWPNFIITVQISKLFFIWGPTFQNFCKAEKIGLFMLIEKKYLQYLSKIVLMDYYIICFSK